MSAALLLAAALAQPALADGLPADGAVFSGPHRQATARPAHRRSASVPHRHHRRGLGAVALEASSYGPPPSHGAHAGSAGPMLVEYGEPYLPRGVLYNVPPPPAWGGGWAVSALN